MRAAVTAAAEMIRLNQNLSMSKPPPGTPADLPIRILSLFTTEVGDTSNTYINICCVCFNVDVTTGTTQLEEANLNYLSKVQAIQNLHYCMGHIAPERLQYLVENGQCPAVGCVLH